MPRSIGLSVEVTCGRAREGTKAAVCTERGNVEVNTAQPCDRCSVQFDRIYVDSIDVHILYVNVVYI